jgi:hypothetical protein
VKLSDLEDELDWIYNKYGDNYSSMLGYIYLLVIKGEADHWWYNHIWKIKGPLQRGFCFSG